MKPQSRYTQRFVRALSVRQDYQLHKRKISNILKSPGPYSTTPHSSTTNTPIKLHQLKLRKQNDLLRLRNQKLKHIDKNNSLMFERLVGSQELTRGTSVANATLAYIRDVAQGRIGGRLERPYVHEMLKKAEEENCRMFQRLKKLKPTIDRRKTEEEYEVARKRKERISRWEGGEMKSKNFVSKEMGRRRAEHNLSSRSYDSRILEKELDSKSTPNSVYHGLHLPSYYTPKAIIRNRIPQPDILTKNRLKQLHRISFRPFNSKLCSDIRGFVDENLGSSNTKFFTTEIDNVNKSYCYPQRIVE